MAKDKETMSSMDKVEKLNELRSCIDFMEEVRTWRMLSDEEVEKVDAADVKMRKQVVKLATSI